MGNAEAAAATSKDTAHKTTAKITTFRMIKTSHLELQELQLKTRILHRWMHTEPSKWPVLHYCTSGGWARERYISTL